VNATAVVTEVAFASNEVVADLVKLFDRFLLDVAFVDTAAGVAETAATGKVVTAHLFRHISIRITGSPGSPGLAGTTTTLATTRTFFSISTFGLDVLPTAVIAMGATSLLEVQADLTKKVCHDMKKIKTTVK
jgi:hypothetical protein